MGAWLHALGLAAALAAPPDAPFWREAVPQPAAMAPPAATAGGLPELSRIAREALPSVVGVTTTQGRPPGATDAQLRELLDRLHDGPRKGVGSGFVIHPDGWVLTNAHVVEGADRVEVDVSGRTLEARVVGLDSESDIALLKVDPDRPLPALVLADSDRLAIADWVMVIGSPFGLVRSVTFGIVSQLGRSDVSPVGRPGSYEFVQTDASINPGNSGGPVLNLRGEVVAIATAVNATGQGIGFAVPINMAKAVLGQLRASGKVVRSWLGLAVKAPEPEGEGLVVTEVDAAGPAAGAGLKVGDVITGFQGRPVATPARLRWFVSTAGVGRAIELRVRRPGQPDRTVRVGLVATPSGEEVRAQARQAAGP
ncbi:MAG: trypsin-like peptidase domain-containing protein [Anaeromyxobacteraceae bacterium]